MLIDETVNRDQEILEYVERKRNGEDFSSIRKELISKGYSDEKVASMMRDIEDAVMASYETKKMRLHPRIIVGFITAFIGITLIAIGFNGIIPFIVTFTGVAMIAVRPQRKGGNIERSKWNRRQ